jgi:tetratricopeptide (TPR) repeat protein
MSYAVFLINADRFDDARREGEKSLLLSGDDPVMAYYGVCLYSRLGDKEKAIELLDKAIAGGYENYEWIARDPDLKNIRGESGYREIMARAGFGHLVDAPEDSRAAT